jgi:short-subunit dehydrogenase
MTETSPVRRVCILGAASAIGEETARLLAAKGDALALVARDAGRLETIARDLASRGASKVAMRTADLARLEDPGAFLDGVSGELGGLDAVLIFHGVLGDQAEARADPSAALRLLEVNFISAAVLSLAAVTRLEASGYPTPALVAVGSVAGDRGRASNFVYGAAKGGLAILYQGLAHDLARGGSKVRAVIVKAGFVDTPMTAAFDKGGPLWAKPATIAAVVVKAMETGGPIVYAPWFWRGVMLAIRLLPQTAMNRVNL